MTSDYFGRLLARYAPVAGAAGAPPSGEPSGGPSGGARPVRVRPRLAGPFERVEALRGEPDGDRPPAAPVPSAAAPSPPAADSGRGTPSVREIHTERHTVVREEAAAPDERPPRAGEAQPPDGRVRLSPAPRTVRHQPETRGQRGTHQAASRADGFDGERAARPARPALVDREGEAAARTAASRTGVDGWPAERGARQQNAVARRGGSRPRERVVHVQIGRLEVSAATPPGAGRGAAAEPGRRQPGRTAPTVGLDDYLARRRTGERSN